MTTRTVENPIGDITLVRRIALGMLPGPLRRGPTGGELPELTLERRAVQIDGGRLAAYSRLCGFPIRDRLPATYLHNVAFPLAIELMTDRRFPFAPLGMIHLENRITQLRPVGVGERPDVRLWADGAAPHRAGTSFIVHGEASIDGEIVWRDDSLYLAPGATGGASDGANGNGERPQRAPGSARRSGFPPAPQPEAVWELPADIGRRFASVSGDRNPIHLSSLTARAFGLPSAIAHGMYLKARCVAALDAELPDAFSVEVRFRRPARLPSRVGFSTSELDGRRMFAVHQLRRGTPHVLGSIEPV